MTGKIAEKPQKHVINYERLDGERETLIIKGNLGDLNLRIFGTARTPLVETVIAEQVLTPENGDLSAAVSLKALPDFARLVSSALLAPDINREFWRIVAEQSGGNNTIKEQVVAEGILGVTAELVSDARQWDDIWRRGISVQTVLENLARSKVIESLSDDDARFLVSQERKFRVQKRLEQRKLLTSGQPPAILQSATQEDIAASGIRRQAGRDVVRDMSRHTSVDATLHHPEPMTAQGVTAPVKKDQKGWKLAFAGVMAMGCLFFCAGPILSAVKNRDNMEPSAPTATVVPEGVRNLSVSPEETLIVMEDLEIIEPTKVPEAIPTVSLLSDIQCDKYMVKAGDGLYKIARALGVTPQDLIDANSGLTMKSTLMIGQELNKPNCK